ATRVTPSVSISSINANGAPANLAAMKGTIDVSSLLTGAQVTHVDVVLTSTGSTVAATQSFSNSNPSATPLVLSFQSTVVAPGSYTLSVQMFMNGVASPVTASIPVTIIP